MSKITGSCLCGKITFESKNDFQQFHFCHCTQCQKLTGSAHVANLFTQPNNITWLSGADLIKRYDVPNRSISSAFCQECGGSVPYLSLSKEDLIIPAGCLDDEPNIQVQDNIFYAERATWYEKGITSKKFDKFPE